MDNTSLAGLLFFLTITLLVLKVIGVLSITWLQAFGPLLLLFAFIGLLFIVFLILLFYEVIKRLFKK